MAIRSERRACNLYGGRLVYSHRDPSTGERYYQFTGLVSESELRTLHSQVHNCATPAGRAGFVLALLGVLRVGRKTTWGTLHHQEHGSA